VTLEFADTNLFLRYLTNDIPDKADAVEKLLRLASREEILLVTTPLVVAEIVWTLERFYGWSKSMIKASVLTILGTPGIEVEDRDTVLQAVVWYEEKNVNFIDAFHAAWLQGAGIERVHTFDKRHFERFGHLEVSIPG
jgi:predicted nucleic-acid-binding protein